MDKTRVSILAEICDISAGYIERYKESNTIKLPIPYALEAMEIAMKQAFEAGEQLEYNDFNEYLTKLEGSK